MRAGDAQALATEELATEAAGMMSAGWCRRRASIDNLAVDRQRGRLPRAPPGKGSTFTVILPAAG